MPWADRDRKQYDEPPEWFTAKQKKWDALANLDLHEWYCELLTCAELVSGKSASEWEDGVRLVHAFIGPPIVQVMEKVDSAQLHALEKPALILQIYLKAPDATILQEVEKALKKARESFPSPVNMPGPHKLNAKINQHHIDQWIKRRIVELAHLIDWRRSVTDQRKPTDADLARWLFPKHSQPSKELVTARKALDRAVTMIPAFWAQLEGKAPNVTGDPS